MNVLKHPIGVCLFLCLLSHLFYAVEGDTNWKTVNLKNKQLENTYYYFEEESRYQAPVLTSATHYPEYINELGQNVTILTGDQLKTLGVRTLDQALDLLSNTHTQNGGGLISMSMNGLPGAYQKIIVDGVDYRDPIGQDRSARLAGLLVDNIDRIEIISGSQGVQYGTQAISGVVNIYTKSRSHGGQLHLSLGERYYTYQTAYGLTHEGAKLNIAYSLKGDSRQSWLQNSAEFDLEKSEQLNLSIEKNIFSQTQLRFGYTKNSLEQDLDDFPPPFYNAFDDPHDFLNAEHDSRAIQIFHKLSPDLDIKAFYSDSKVFRSEFNQRVFPNVSNPSNNLEIDTDYYKGRFSFIDVQSIYHQDRLSFVVGASTGTEKAEKESTLFGNLTPKTRVSRGIYSSFKFQFPWFITELGGRSQYVGGNQYFTKSVSFIKNFSGNVTVYSSYQTGFNEPTLLQQFGGNVSQSPLTVEKSQSKTLGVRKLIGEHLIELSAFEIEYNNKISSNFNFFTGANFYENVSGESQSMGQTISYKRAQGKFLDFLNLDYTWVSSKSPKGILSNVPTKKFAMNVGGTIKKVSIGFNLNHIGPTKGFNSSTFLNELYPSFTRANINFIYRLTPKIDMNLKIDNVLNTVYKQNEDFQTLGRSYLVGVTYQL